MKDNKFVYCAWKLVIDEVLEEAQRLGVVIGQIIFKVIILHNDYNIGPCVKSDGPPFKPILELWDGVWC